VRTQPRRSGPRAALSVLCVVMLGLGAVAYAWHAHQGRLPAGTSEFAAGRGVLYTAPDHAYTVQFPKTPEASDQSQTFGSVTLTINMALASSDDYEMGVGKIDLPAAVPDGQVDELLEASMNAGMEAAKGDIDSKERITRDGLPAMEAHVHASDGYSARVLVVLSQQRLFMLVVHAKSGVDKLFDALNASFVTQPTAV
jgi:hypothetical protein